MFWTSLMAQTVKRLPTIWETRFQSLGGEDPLEKEMATHSNIFAWKIPWTEEPGRLQSMGSQRVGHDWAISLSLFTFFHFEGHSAAPWVSVVCMIHACQLSSWEYIWVILACWVKPPHWHLGGEKESSGKDAWCPGWAEKVFPYRVSSMVPPAWFPYSSLCGFCLSSTEDDEDEEIVHMGNAIMSFYSALIDLLGRCAPEMHVSDECPESSFEGLESGTW